MKLNFVSKIFSLFLTFRMEEINRIKENPIPFQENLLLDLVFKARNTEFGQKYNFFSIKNITDFQKNVPIHMYEDIFPYIEKMMNGKENILWPGLITNFSKSSGTTARSKFIPVSSDNLESAFKGGRDEVGLYLKNNPDSHLLEGKSIIIGGSGEIIKNDPEIFCGDMSAIHMHNLPILGAYLRTPSLETATLSDYEIKLEKMAEETMREDVRSLAGVPTWTLLLIKKVVEKSKAKSILDVWPNLEVFFHGAVAFEPYRKTFEEIIPKKDMHYMETYNASEGWFAVQDDPTLVGEMLLMPDYGIFYEFIPMNEFGKENPKTYTMKDVKVGENYALVISTNSGLWRYIIGDTISFTSTFPHRIKITGRTKHFINAFGEEVVVHNTDTAIKKACEETGSTIVDYTACPVFMSENKSGGHEWVVEFEKAPQSIEQFVDILDTTLRKINSDYDAKRHKDIALKKLILHSVPPQTFYIWMKSRGKLGGQNKVPRLSNSREYVEGILKIL